MAERRTAVRQPTGEQRCRLQAVKTRLQSTFALASNAARKDAACNELRHAGEVLVT